MNTGNAEVSRTQESEADVGQVLAGDVVFGEGPLVLLETHVDQPVADLGLRPLRQRDARVPARRRVPGGGGGGGGAARVPPGTRGPRGPNQVQVVSRG